MVNTLAPNSFRCPHCGHQITMFECFILDNFGALGLFIVTRKGCCGCLIVIVIAFVLLVLGGAVRGKNSNGSTPENRTQTSENR